MRKANSKKEIQFSCLSGDEIAGNDENEDEITWIDRRTEVLNTVLEKVIDKINHPQNPEKAGER